MSFLKEQLIQKFKLINCTHDDENNSDQNLSFDSFPHCNLDMPEQQTLTKCAVFVLLFNQNNKFLVLLTVRSFKLKKFPGEVCFPGGKLDSADASFREAALREANEEIGLRRENVEVVAQICPFISPSGHYIAPVIGLIRHSVNTDQDDPCENTLDVVLSLKPNPDEVESIFWVEIDYALDRTNSERISIAHHPFKLDKSISWLLDMLDSANLKENSGILYSTDFCDRMVINFNNSVFRDNLVATYPFIYGINATILLTICILLEEKNLESAFEIMLNGQLVTRKNIHLYLRYFRFCTYVLLRGYCIEKKAKQTIKSNI